MHVFVLEGWIDYEVGRVLGVFATLEAAEEGADREALRRREEYSYWAATPGDVNYRARYAGNDNQSIQVMEVRG